MRRFLNRSRLRAGELKLFSQVVYVVSQKRNFAGFAAKGNGQTDLLRPNGLRDFEAVSGVSREQIRLLKPPRLIAVSS